MNLKEIRLKLGDTVLYGVKELPVKVIDIKPKAIYIRFPDGKKIPVREKMVEVLLKLPK